MDRQQLAHVLRAACEVSGDPEMVVLGSQAILGSYDEDELPAEVLVSMEADLAWLADGPDRERAERVNGLIGELSQFESTNGYYPEGISVATAVLPDGWRDRLQRWTLRASEPARPLFLDRHDLAVAKLAANRIKDRVFVSVLAAHGLLDIDAVRERVLALPEGTDQRVTASILQFVDSLPAATDSRGTGHAMLGRPRRRLRVDRDDFARCAGAESPGCDSSAAAAVTAAAGKRRRA